MAKPEATANYEDIARGKRLAEARKAAGLTQRQLADRVKYDPVHVSRAELGKVEIKGRFRDAIVEVLGDAWIDGSTKPLSVREPSRPTTPYDAVQRDELYTTASPLVREWYDASPPKQPSGRSRDNLMAFYKEWLAALRAQDRMGTLGPVNVLRPGETVDEEPEG